MADLIYAWSDMEANLKAGKDYYLHGKMTDFNTYCSERHPDYIWIVRQEKQKLWLLGKLFVTESPVKNPPKDLDRYYVFYDPSKSVLFADVDELSDSIQADLKAICKNMSHATFQGKRALDKIEPDKQQILKNKTKAWGSTALNDPRIFDLFNAGTPPYRSVKKSKGTSPNKMDTRQGVENVPSFIGAKEAAFEIVNSEEQLKIDQDTASMSAEDREAVVKVRVGQGKFRDGLINKFGDKCWMSQIEGKQLLIASHIKPWSHCDKDKCEKGDIHNGLLLSALWDAAFDKKLIAFDEDWKVMVSPNLSESAKAALGISADTKLPEQFQSPRRKEYLKYHRDLFLLELAKSSS